MSVAAATRSIFISGSSRGLGLEMVRQLTKSKSHPEVLIAACRNPSTATDLQSIAKENAFVKIMKLDIENDDDIDAAVKETKSLVGEFGLNLLINNAGIFLNKADGGAVHVQSRERMQQTFNVNSTSPIIMTQKFLPLLELAAAHHKDEQMSCKKAASICISSGMGSQQKTYDIGFGTCLAYKCSKSAVNMAVLLMAQQLKESGVLVMGLHPGWVQTDMGGPDATLTMDQSVAGMLKTLDMAEEKHMGLMLDYNGEIYPF